MKFLIVLFVQPLVTLIQVQIFFQALSKALNLYLVQEW